MKILYIHQHFRFPEEPGITRSWEFARRLVGDGHAVTVLAGHAQPIDLRRDGLRVVRLRVPYDQRMANARRIVSFLDFIARSIKFAVHQKYDIVLASSGPLTVAIPGLVAAARSRSRFVFEVRDVWPKLPIELGELRNPVAIYASRILERLTYAVADEVVTLSPGMQKDVRSVNPRVHTSVVPNASDIGAFRRGQPTREEARAILGWEADAPYLTYVGSMGRSYDVPWLVDLASVLAPHGVRMKIVGEGTAFEAALTKAAQLGLDPEGLVIGAVPKTLVPTLLRASDLVFSVLADNPALQVNSLTKVFDAFAAERPLLFNHGGWLAEIATDHGAGWVVSREITRAADQVLKILAHENLIKAAAASGRIADSQFSRDALYNQFRRAVLGTVESP